MTSGPRVGANLLWLVPGVVGGSEDYTVRLLASYARAPHDRELTLFVNRSFRSAHPRLASTYPTIVAPVDGQGKARRVVAEATWLSRRARTEGIGLVHHMGGNMLRTNPPGMVTIHDLQPFAHPEHFSRLKHVWLQSTVPQALRRAVVVVTLTEHTRGDVVERMGVPLERILLVPPGIDRSPDAPDEHEVARVRRTYHLADRPYFVYPAITYPHKNHLQLVRAFAQLAIDHREVLLVLTGGEAQGEAALRGEIGHPVIGDRVRRLGRIPRVDLDVLIADATALAFPSSYEGFGIPVLEAMSRGCPVIASTATALPEVVGDAGLLVDPDDVDAWAAAMRSVVDDPSLRRELAERGLARAAEFSWERSVRAMDDAYRAAIDRAGL